MSFFGHRCRVGRGFLFGKGVEFGGTLICRGLIELSVIGDRLPFSDVVVVTEARGALAFKGDILESRQNRRRERERVRGGELNVQS